MTLKQRPPDAVSGFKVVGLSFVVLALLIGVVTIFSAWFTVPEGHVGVVQKFGKSVRMEAPGFHWKTPWIESVVELEVRERVDGETLAAATANQLPVTATVTMNWSLTKEAVMDTYIQYGSLDQFVRRIMLPRLRSASKAAISRFRADEIIRNRSAVVAAIRQQMEQATEGLPRQISSVQLENVELPPAYMKSVEEKEQARENAEKEKHRLAQQKLVAQQKVQTAEAERDANKALADGNAYRTLTESEAEAQAIALINEQLARSPAYVKLVEAKRWDGVLPRTMLGDGSGVLLGLSAAK